MQFLVKPGRIVVAVLLSVLMLAAPASAASFLWKKQPGTAAFDAVRFLRGDDAGNVIIGYQYSVGTPGSETLAYAIIKYDPAGTQVWRRNQSGDFNGLALDPAGNIYAVVQTTSNGPAILKYTADGVLLWRRKLNDGYGDPVALAVDDSGRPVAIYAGSPRCSAICVVSHAADGSISWKKQIGINNITLLEVDCVSIDREGNILISGISGATQQDYFDSVWIAKLSPSGALAFINVFDNVALASMESVSVQGITSDAVGNVILAGFAAGDLTGQPERCGAAICAFVAKFWPDGGPAWTKILQYRPINLDYTNSQAQVVTTGPFGDIVVAGLRDVLKAKDSQLYSRPFVATFTTDGTPLSDWYWPFSAFNNFMSWPTAGISVDALGNIAFGGSTSGGLAGTYKGRSDGFLAKLKP